MNDTTTQTQTWCRWCDEPIRWSNAYDEPHYVHVTSLATINCPGLGAGKDVTPA